MAIQSSLTNAAPARRSPTSAQIRRWAQPIVLLGLGFYFLYNLVSGKIALYVNNAQFGWVPWIGAILFLAIGAAQAIDVWRTLPIAADHDHHAHAHDHSDDHDCEECAHDPVEHDHAGHDHSHAPSWLRLSLVAIPLLIGVVVPAHPLGASAASTSGVSTGISSLGNNGGGSIGSFATDPSKRNVLDWIRAFSTSTNLTEFTGQRADLIGFVYKDIRADGKPQFMIARFTISCCVADASAIGVTVQTPDLATANKWKADSGSM